MMKNYNKNIINQHTRNEARTKHGDSERWKNYAERVQKHPFVREYLIQKYNGICQYCGLPIAGDFQIQHGTYDKECIFEEHIRVKYKTKRRPNGTRKVPDCENCTEFHECIDDALYPVHAYCNMLISKEVYKR
jgi:hypothetical protein